MLGGIVSGAASVGTVDLGAGTNGTLEQTVSAGVASVTEFNGTANSVAFYTTNGQLSQDNANLNYNGSALRVPSGLVSAPSLVMAGDTATGWYYTAPASYDNWAFSVSNFETWEIGRSTTTNGPMLLCHHLPCMIGLTGLGAPSASTNVAADTLGNMYLFANDKQVVLGMGEGATGTIPTTSTASFPSFVSMAGVPTGAPSGLPTGAVPTVFDASHQRFYAYMSGWETVGQYDGAVGAPGILKTDTSGNHSIAAAGTDFAPAGSCATHSFATATNASTLTCSPLGSGDVPCGALPATAGGSDVSRSAGTCSETVVAIRDGSGARWPTSGTWANGDVLFTAAGDLFAGSTISCTNLPAFSGGAITSTGGTCAVTLDGPSVAAATTKLIYSLPLLLGANTPNTWLPEGSGSFTNGQVVEYPNDFKAGHMTVKWYLRSNVITAGNLAAAVSLNGTGIGGSGTGNINSVTATGVHTIGPFVTGSTSASDTYGLFFTTDASFAATSPNSAYLTFELILTP